MKKSNGSRIYTFLGVTGLALGFRRGGDKFMWILLGLCAIDIVLGVFKALSTKGRFSFRSKTFYNGVIRKAAYFLLIFAVILIKDYTEIPNLSGALIGLFSLYEFSSILENLNEIGVPIHRIPGLARFVQEEIEEKEKEINESSDNEDH